MRGSVVGVLFCSFCFLAGAGVESQRTIKVGLPFADKILSAEAGLEALLSGGGSILITLLQNLLLSNRPREQPVMMQPSGAARLAASLRGLLSAITNSAGQGVQSLFGSFLYLWRVLNQMIATVARAVARTIMRALIGLRSAKVVKNADDLRRKLLALLARLRPSNIIKNVKIPNPFAAVGNLSKRVFGIFGPINKLLGEYMRNAIYDTINRTIRSFVTSIANIPKNLIDSVKKLGKRLTTRPKPLRDLLSFLTGAVRKARETYAKGMRRIFGLVFNILGRLTGYLIDALRRTADKFRNRLTQGLRAIPTAISKLGGRLSRRGPLSRIVGFLVNLLARRIKLLIDTVNAIENGIIGIIRGIMAIIRRLIGNAIGFLWNTLYTIFITRRLIGLNNLRDFLFNLIPRPGKFLGRISQLIRGIRDRRRARIQKIFDALKNLLSNIFKRRPKIIPILWKRVQRIVQRQPFRQAFNVVVTIGKDIQAIIRGAVRILVQLVLRFTVGGSVVATFVSNLFGGRGSNRSRPSILNRIAGYINAATSIITKLTGRGGLLKLLMNGISGLFYVFEPFFRSR